MTAVLDPVGVTRPGGTAEAGPVPTRVLRVARTPRPDAADDHVARWDHLEVPVASTRMTVLDALTWARAHLDPTLDLRHGCYHASCGTCGMQVDGRAVLACVTRLDDLAEGEVTVEPLLNQPVVSDLVVDIETLYAAFDAVGMPLVRGSDAVSGAVPAAGVDTLTRFEDCIECGLCVSACPIEASDAAYAGPGVLAAAWRVIEEPRDADPERAFALVDGDQGAWRCHLAFECSEACPSGALPAEGIMHLRRGLLRHRLRAAFAHLRASAGNAGSPGSTGSTGSTG
jgi:succinate dehydrogenase / fumarate reductase iron-sulfur subunit